MIFPKLIPIFIFFTYLCFVQVNSAILKTISSQSLLQFAKINEYLLVVFVENECQACKDAELEVAQLAASMSDSLLEVTFVRMVGTEIPQQYGITDKPAILFYRHSKPLIYDGPREAAALEEWISFNKEQALKSLNDDNFEHLTQAASGATTGDWLVFFCESHLDSCQKLQPVFETTASKLTGKRNVAFVDISSNPSLTERFNIGKSLTILFLRLGKVYEYSIEKLDVTSLTAFAQGWYKNVMGVPVPIPPSPFDQLLTKVVNLESSTLIGAGLVIGIVLLFLVILSKKSSPKKFL